MKLTQRVNACDVRVGDRLLMEAGKFRKVIRREVCDGLYTGHVELTVWGYKPFVCARKERVEVANVVGGAKSL